MSQVSVSVVLVVGAVLLARGFMRLVRVDPGFSSARVVTFRVAPPFQRYRNPESQAAFHRQLVSELRALPGVSAVGTVSHLPYDNLPNWATPYVPSGAINAAPPGLADARTADPGLLNVLGARLLAGRWFTEDDRITSETRVVVDDLFASRVWPGQDPIGRVVRIDPNASGTVDVDARVIGVIAHLRHRSLTETGREQIYVAARQVIRNPVAYLVRLTNDAGPGAGALRGAVRRVDPALPVYDMRPLDEYVDRARSAQRFTLMLAMLFAGVAGVLATVGVYGVVAYTAQRQRREFGVRLALGARPIRVVGQVLFTHLGHVVMGTLIGVTVAWFAAPLMRAQLYETAPRDPLSYFVAAAGLIVASVVAMSFPAWRAVRHTPLSALRDE